jgi:chorismate mutase / prephenate dehydratase
MSDSKPTPELLAIRDTIDALDQDILKLISERARCAQQVAEIKMQEVQSASGRGDDIAEPQFYRPEREAQVLLRLKERNEGPLADDTIAYIFREIMSACLALERPLQVAYLGPEGTFTQAAALKHFGHAAVCVSQGTIDRVFAEVESGGCHYGIVPVENSTEGMVSHTLDSFIDTALHIVGEVEIPIHHYLLALKGSDPNKITKIIAHQQALAQCRNWLSHHWSHVEWQAVASNGEAAKRAAKEPGVAAIAGEAAADFYGLEKLAEHIEDNPDNTTRFLVIGRDEVPPSGHDKTSLVVSSRNKPGALLGLLEPFRREGISLTRIDTRPSKTEKWAYVFFIEFEGHCQDARVAAILSELEEQSILIKVIGSYPRAVL